MTATDDPEEAGMAKEIFEAFEGQQDMLGFSQATKVGDTIYGLGHGGHRGGPVHSRVDG